MTTPRDWVPPYRGNDERNRQHRMDYLNYAVRFPKSSWRERQDYADQKLREREKTT
jgi:hypothetical protein